MQPPRIEDPWGERTPYGAGERWPVRVDMQLAGGLREEDVERWVPSASILHSNGDGQEIAVKDGRIVGVRGRADDRVNHGRLGPKDLYGWQANNAPDRLTRPLIRQGGELVETDWDAAMERVAGRARELQAAAPDVWAELSAADAQALGVREGDTIAITSARGELRAPARVTGIRPGVVFVPFHYGYWDAEADDRHRAANELTLTVWDPVSKQPLFKVAAVAVAREG